MVGHYLFTDVKATNAIDMKVPATKFACFLV